jgi:hypothetical protein
MWKGCSAIEVVVDLEGTDKKMFLLRAMLGRSPPGKHDSRCILNHYLSPFASLNLILLGRMCGFLAILAANAIGLVFLCLYMLYAAVIILFVVCTFAAALGFLTVQDGLRQLGLQI